MRVIRIFNKAHWSCDECGGTPKYIVWQIISAFTGNYITLCIVCLLKVPLAIGKREKRRAKDAEESSSG